MFNLFVVRSISHQLSGQYNIMSVSIYICIISTIEPISINLTHCKGKAEANYSEIQLSILNY